MPSRSFAPAIAAAALSLALSVTTVAAQRAPVATARQATTDPVQSKEAFSDARFAALQQEGALILLDVFASWCPTCAIQQKVIADYQSKHPEVPLKVLTIDFDSQKDVVRRFRAPRQSTLIVYRGTERVWFGVAETRAAVIFAELNKAAAALAQ